MKNDMTVLKCYNFWGFYSDTILRNELILSCRLPWPYTFFRVFCGQKGYLTTHVMLSPQPDRPIYRNQRGLQWRALLMSASIIVLSGPSGVGKGSLCELLLQKTSERMTISGNPMLALSVSATSRPMRAGETEGVSYHFMSPEQFKLTIDQDGFLEWAQYNGHYYGTPKAPIDVQLTQGTSVLLEIDVQGALQVKASYPMARLVFIAPPPHPKTGNPLDTLLERLQSRGNTPPLDIERRLTISAQELTQQAHFDHVFINDTLPHCCDMLMHCLQL
jgi:guanylate kinase